MWIQSLEHHWVCAIQPSPNVSAKWDYAGCLQCLFLSLFWLFAHWISCFISREIFDELLETEKNSLPINMEGGKAIRQTSWEIPGSQRVLHSLWPPHLGLIQEQHTAQGNTKRWDTNCSLETCFYTCPHYPLSPTCVALPFVLGEYLL